MIARKHYERRVLRLAVSRFRRCTTEGANLRFSLFLAKTQARRFRVRTGLRGLILQLQRRRNKQAYLHQFSEHYHHKLQRKVLGAWLEALPALRYAWLPLHSLAFSPSLTSGLTLLPSILPFRNRNSLERKASEFNAARLLRRVLHALRAFLDRKAKLALLGASLHHKGQLVTKYEVLRGWRAEFQRRRMNFMRLASFWGTQALRSQHKVFRGWAHWCRRR